MAARSSGKFVPEAKKEDLRQNENLNNSFYITFFGRKEVKEVHIQLSQDNLQIQFLYEEDRLKEFVQIKSTLFFGSSLKPFIY